MLRDRNRRGRSYGRAGSGFCRATSLCPRSAKLTNLAERNGCRYLAKNARGDTGCCRQRGPAAADGITVALAVPWQENRNRPCPTGDTVHRRRCRRPADEQLTRLPRDQS